jgi:hypothetical protein
MNWRSAFILAGIGGCSGKDDPAFVLAYDVRTSAPSTVALGTQPGRLAVSEAWLRLAPLGFVGDCEFAPLESDAPGIGFVEFVESEPVAQTLTFPTRSLCTISTALVPDPEATDEPIEIAGDAGALLGTLPDGRAFEVHFREEIPIELVLENELVPEEATWLLSFDVAAWLDIGELEAVSGFPVIVSADTNVGIYSGILARLIYGIQVHEDLDVDGQVDLDERRIDVR